MIIATAARRGSANNKELEHANMFAQMRRTSSRRGDDPRGSRADAMKSPGEQGDNGIRLCGMGLSVSHDWAVGM